MLAKASRHGGTFHNRAVSEPHEKRAGKKPEIGLDSYFARGAAGGLVDYRKGFQAIAGRTDENCGQDNRNDIYEKRDGSFETVGVEIIRALHGRDWGVFGRVGENFPYGGSGCRSAGRYGRGEGIPLPATLKPYARELAGRHTDQGDSKVNGGHVRQNMPRVVYADQTENERQIYFFLSAYFQDAGSGALEEGCYWRRRDSPIGNA